MRIAVNTRFLLQNKLEGIGVFTNEVCKRLVAAHPEHEFIFLFDRPYSQEFVYAKNVEPVVVSPQARHAILFYLWFEWAIPFALKKHKADLFFSPDGYLSLKTKLPQVQVIHDLAFEHYPQNVGKMASWHYRHFFPKYARKAKKILTVSAYSKADVIKQYGVSDRKIDVVYNGAKDVFKPIGPEEKQAIMQKYSQGAPYFLYVGALHQRKNIGNLLRAFEDFKDQGHPHKLLIVGRKAWGTAEMESIFNVMQHQNDVVFTGRVDDNELAKIVAGAYALTYVSYFEGFGIPILEAMQCGVPSITSNLTSMPEVAGKAGLLVDPFNVNDIATTMTQITNQETYLNLQSECQNQAQKFSWEKTADKVWQGIEKAMP
ncbi:MAG: glycosyltransferase family 4 protein [Bacteroidetes bacterium]|nr:glycosyltransferase family 4 protein [Bacteroidota bacterium]